MGDVIKLSQFRKVKAKAAKEDEAAANRRKFGRTKAEKESEAFRRQTEEKKLDQHKMPPDPDNAS